VAQCKLNVGAHAGLENGFEKNLGFFKSQKSKI